MNSNFKRTEQGGLTEVVRKYGYYGLLALSISILALVVILTSPVDDNNVNVGTEGLIFEDPIANATILKNYSDDQLLFNETLNQWEAHKAIDFVAPEGTNVLAALDGTIESIYTNSLDGTVLVIDHGDGLKTIYGSLDSQLNFEEGDEVEKGDVVGTASNSAMNEADDGSHLHFEVWEDGTKVDPSAYLASSDK